MITQVSDKEWKSQWLKFVDLGKTEGGVTHRYSVRNFENFPLGTVLWRAGWRKYIFRTLAVGIDFDTSCLTTIAEFCTLRTDERKADWKPQGRFGKP